MEYMEHYDDCPFDDDGALCSYQHICDDDGPPQLETCPACWILSRASEPDLMRPPV
jgi:hypothetical protein